MSITHIRNGVLLPVDAQGFQVMEDGISESENNGKLSATIKLIGPSGNRFAFIRSISGHAYLDGVDVNNDNIIRVVPPISYPDNPTMFLQGWSTQVKGRPVDWQTGLPISDLGDVFSGECDLNDCEITLTFAEPEEDGGTSGGVGRTDSRLPSPPTGTFLTVDESWGTEEVQVEVIGRTVSQKSTGYASETKETKPETDNVTIQIHDITFNWSGVVAPDWDKIYSYVGYLNYNPFWGYPLGAVRLEGLQKTMRLNVRNQWVYDMRITFRAKTVPSQGYESLSTSHALEVKNKRLGVWNRVWLPEAVGTSKQHWWVTAGPEGGYDSPVLQSGENFSDIFTYPPDHVVLT